MSQDERDPSLDAAWRKASREEPAPALDAAIRAAAASSVRGRNKHWWYPLAAAATVAVLAVGIAQLTPPERIEPTASDMGAAPSAQRGAGAPPAAAIDSTVATPPATKLKEPVAVTPAPGVAAGTAQSERARQSPANAPPGPASETRAQDRLARNARELAEANSAPSAPPAAVPAPPARPLSEPFPAAATAQPHREAVFEEAKPRANAPAEEATEPIPAQSPRVSAAKVANADAANVAQAAARAVDDWIKRIRELRNAGRLDDAAKELAAFRSTYGERADALLPADLRQIKP
jgi:hypothetical protein